MDKRYNTGNPRPSNSMKDLNDNALAYDDFLNSESDTFIDRFGNAQDTMIGTTKKMAAATDAVIDEARQNLIPLSKQYMTLADAQADIANIPEGSTTYYRSPDDSALAIEIINSGGKLAATGRKMPSQVAVDDVSKIASVVERRTNGVNTINAEDGRYVFTDLKGRMSLEIESNGDKKLYGKTQSDTMTISVSMGMGNVDQVPSDDSDYVWGIGGKNQRIAVGFRRDKKTFELHGIPLTTQRGQMPNDVFSIGDSITAFGQSASQPNATGKIYKPLVNAQCWSAWAMLLTNGKYRYAGMSATPGYTTSQILAEHVPKAIAASPSFCIVLAGRNDVVKGIDIDGVTIPAMTAIFRELRYAGIVPVICTMSAQSGNTDSQNIARYKINAFCRAYATKHGLPLVDLHVATTDPHTGEWISGYNQDVSHPTPLGAKVMGNAVATAMAEWQAPTYPPMAVSVTTPGNSDNMLSNPLFIDSASGVPAGWVVDTAGSFNVESDPAVSGNAFIASGSGASVALCHTTIAVTAGRKMGFGARLSITSNVNSWVSCYVLAGSDINDSDSTVYLCGVRNWKQNTDGYGYFYYEFVVPDDVEEVSVVVKAQDGTIRIAQMGIFELADVTGI